MKGTLLIAAGLVYVQASVLSNYGMQCFACLDDGNYMCTGATNRNKCASTNGKTDCNGGGKNLASTGWDLIEVAKCGNYMSVSDTNITITNDDMLEGNDDAEAKTVTIDLEATYATASFAIMSEVEGAASWQFTSDDSASISIWEADGFGDNNITGITAASFDSMVNVEGAVSKGYFAFASTATEGTSLNVMYQGAAVLAAGAISVIAATSVAF